MIAACPKCQTRYRVEPERLGADGARLRCSQCRAVFRVRLPAPAPAPLEPVVAVEKTPVHEAAPQQGAGSSQPTTPEERTRSAPTPTAPADTAPHFDRSRLVLLAHPNPDACKRVAEVLEREGLQVLVAHDGVEAILTVQRALPRAVVLDAALPKMFGFQVCELIKRNESLRVTHVCLIGAIHREDRYRRAPSEIYGADFYIEAPSLPGALVDWLVRIGFEIPGRAAPAAAPPLVGTVPADPGATGGLASDVSTQRRVARGEANPLDADADPGGVTRGAGGGSRPTDDRSGAGRTGPPTVAARTAPEVAPQSTAIGRIGVPADPLAAERAQAERLARIIVSDIVLYNEEKFSAAVRSGGVLETMRDELAEGRALFRERVHVDVRDERDFLADEVMRVAHARGAS